MITSSRILLSPHIRKKIEPWLFLIPLIFVLLLVAYPVGTAIWLSLTDKRVGFEPNFIGLENYKFLIENPVFIKTTMNTLIYTIVGVSAKLFIGMVMALVVNESFFFRNIARGILALPWVIPTVVTVLIWYWMFNELNGVINLALKELPLVKPLPWLSDRWLAMVSIIIVNAWRGFAFFGINLLAGMQAIDQELYEAAKVDGANAVQRFLYVTLPGLRNVIFVTTTLSIIWTLNDFQIVHILTRGGPGTATQVFATLTYEIGIASLQLGRGIAVSLMLFPVILLIITFLVIRIQRD